MVRQIQFLFLGLLASLSLFAQAQSATTPKIQIVNFTADWCPACKVFDPRLTEALEQMADPGIEWLSVDLTITKTGSREQKNQFWMDFVNDMIAADLLLVHKGWNGFPNTGYAVVLAADTKEPLVCFMGAPPVDSLKLQLKEALSRVANRPPGHRVPEGADCPPSFL
tara:strand:- start:13517 stop:14017 length:501 start_codon:yes stop_codon:yes gene_type:complete